ncbi:DUF456 domain-containing protein [Halorubellus sp. JP-L1]|uniref:DUF456 domain-containing protein n=1 Tax=Halorubellus sp. JP-L1 TaxID=2715753 RepID=UPI00140BCB41|nr:DUF456 domain-containing protein [Halorubellus sp. JP-L1]NHN40700.1 DUF456 domain-containing protein [Halorubellus sp. JP-L1]
MLFGLDLVTVLAVLLLVAGVVGSAVPSVPGPLVSLAGVLVYAFGGGNAVGVVTLVALGIVGVVAVLADWLSGSLAAKYGGASWTASILGGIVGVVMFFVWGPLGVILGLAATVFLVEAYREDAQHATKATVYSTIGALGSIVVQVALTLGMLATFALALAV